jgi:cobalt-zinc-cadmium resistance protein CzcA
LGALIFTLTLVPVMSHLLLKKNVREKNNPFVNFWDRSVMKGFKFTFKNKNKPSEFTVILAITLFSAKFLGTEFLPQLNEGSLWITAEMPMSSSLKESLKTADVQKIS